MAENKYITVAYKLFAPMQDNDRELIEEATVERPFQFISALGMTLDAFEAQIAPLAPGASFDIKLSTDEAYGPFIPEAVQKVPADIFKINGKIDKRYIYEGAVVPLQNADGERFNGTITEIVNGIQAGTEVIEDMEFGAQADDSGQQQNKNPFMPGPRNNKNQQKK